MLEESPAALIRATIENFHIQPDLQTFNRIEENLEELFKKRQTKLENERETLQILSRELEMIKDSISDMKNSEANKEMSSELIAVENKKFQLAKNLTELESQINYNNLNLNKLMINYNNLINEQRNLMNENILDNPDSTVLKLKIYKNLGVKIVNSDNGNGDGEENVKVIIYNQDQDLTSFLNVDEKYGDYFVSNYIWDRL